jgi:Outer membrane protein beta-barrel domain
MRFAVSVVFLAVVLLASPAAAQQRQFGIKAGPSWVAVDVDDVDDEEINYKRRVVGVFGGFVVLPLNDRVAAQIELLWSPKGGKLADIEGAALKLKLGYAEVPVLARVAVTRSASGSFFIFGGVAPAFRTSAQFETSFTGGGMTSGDSIDIGADFDRFDVGIVIGAGMDIGQWIVVDGRYSWGLVDVNRNPEITASIKNRALTFMGGVRF